MLHRMSAYHNRQILCSTLLAYSVYSTVGRHVRAPRKPISRLTQGDPNAKSADSHGLRVLGAASAPA